MYDILLMEARSYTMKYKAYKKKEREMLTNGLKRQIEGIQDSNEEEDMTKLEMLKKFLQDLIDYENNEAAMLMLTKHHLEGEKPTKLFTLWWKKEENFPILLAC